MEIASEVIESITIACDKLSAEVRLLQNDCVRLEQIVQRIMTMHWDMQACNCWICEEGRKIGCKPISTYLDWRGKYGYVDVKDGKK